MSALATRALVTRAPMTAASTAAMSEKKPRGSYRFAGSTSQVTQSVPKQLLGKKCLFRYRVTAAPTNPECTQLAFVPKGEAVPTLTLNQVSSFDTPSEGAAPTIEHSDGWVEWFIPEDAAKLTFICSLGTGSYLELFVGELLNPGVAAK